MTDGAGDPTEDGDDVGVVAGVGVGVGLTLGLPGRDGRGELAVGFGLVGVTVGVVAAGVTVAGVVVALDPDDEEDELPCAGDVGLTQT